MKDAQLQALIRKNAAKAAAPKGKPRRTYDATLDATHRVEPAPASEAEEIFDEMKRRDR